MDVDYEDEYEYEDGYEGEGENEDEDTDQNQDQGRHEYVEPPRIPDCIVYISPGVWARVAPSDTNIGTHTRWMYGYHLPILPPLKVSHPEPYVDESEDEGKVKVEPATDPVLYRTVFGGDSSLSSFSSFSSLDSAGRSGASFSDLSSTQLSPTTSYEILSSPPASIQTFNTPSAPNRVPQTPSRSRRRRGKRKAPVTKPAPAIARPTSPGSGPIRTRSPRSPRPLGRAPTQQWTTDATGNPVSATAGLGNFSPVRPLVRSNPFYKPVERGGPKPADLYRIHADQLVLLMAQGKQVAQIVKVEGDDNESDMLRGASEMRPIPTRPAPAAPTAECSNHHYMLGPERQSTEIIDHETFNPGPAEVVGVYPSEWVRCQMIQKAGGRVPTDPI
ncbi:hypothetical protein CPB84DRAFT_1843938 [Gymnopilus junonius]|uniref:Uncharacterized protein n=1 Tax=Gymnopilus junonius TaxID=109634 RepID=A0A9P5TRN3_GYMJU|nr:hypothetical protein CPB84DRAFT_1843938 [Gymnopilus junonius]